MLKKALPYILPIVAGIALLPIPLLRDFHFESAMLAAIIGCFWAGLRAASRNDHDFFSSLRVLSYLYAGSIPLFIHALISGCLSFEGFGFWVITPFPSVLFGTAIGRLVRKFQLPFPKSITSFILLFIAIGVLIIEFFSFPQVYFFNHVWGHWPGPIYDEAVPLTGAYLYFRWITLLWILLLWILPVWDKNGQTKIITTLAFISLLFSYLNLDEARIISPENSIQQQLGDSYQTTHFDLYYPADYYTLDEIHYWAAQHEFYFHQITTQLQIDWPENRKINTYLYGHAWQKKRLTGAKYTSYVPIWLEQDQLHIAKQQLEGALKHELVHVLSKQFGNSLFNGSWSIGLVEGLAEAVAGDASLQSTLHQIVAGERPFPTAEEMETSLSFSGFYSSAGAISYTTSGSFVKFLLNHYPVSSFKKSYRTSKLEQGYDIPIDSLVKGWHHTLRNTPLDSLDQQVSEFIFAQQSLFEKPCPHSLTRVLQLWDAYQFRLAEQDTLSAYDTLDRLYQEHNENDWIKRSWVRSRLLLGEYNQVMESITPGDTLLTLQVLKADAYFLAGEYEQAEDLLSGLRPRITSSSASTFRHTLELRRDRKQWAFHVNRRYQNEWADSSSFVTMNLPNQMLSLQKALEDDKKHFIRLYASLLSTHTPDSEWFGIYEKAINTLVYMEEFELAKNWISLAGKSMLRLRYQERLENQQQWLKFWQAQTMVED